MLPGAQERLIFGGLCQLHYAQKEDIGLPVASSGIAACDFPEERTAHSRFSISYTC
ncbi:PIF1-like helicase [Medicago truncatula]|uniref:ATP-dependent DNA helicase n=1 Tax=Medicago truncatula TaxID=3880 RepID=A0A072TFK0_MEDTR|nr:PIF1-like helicase [Medicago truncatula]